HGSAGSRELDREGARQRDRPAPTGAGDGGARAVGAARRGAPPRLPLLPLGDDHGGDVRDPAQRDRPAHPRAAALTADARGRRSQPSPLRRWLAPPFTAFVFLIHPLVALSRPGGLLQDPGTGWHLVTGRLILDTGSVPARELFSFTAAGHPWIDQSWLFDAGRAVLERLDDFQNGRLRARALWWLPLLALVWANMHGGFLIGFVLAGVFAGVAALRAVVFRDTEERRRALVFAAVLVAMGLATLVNP